MHLDMQTVDGNFKPYHNVLFVYDDMVDDIDSDITVRYYNILPNTFTFAFKSLNPLPHYTNTKLLS